MTLFTFIIANCGYGPSINANSSKRNVGIIYEQLLKIISEGLVTDNLGKAKEAK